MKHLLKILSTAAITLGSGLAFGSGTTVYYYTTPDPYYPIYYSVDRYTGTHYLREPYYAREPYYRIVKKKVCCRTLYRPVTWIPSHPTRHGYYRTGYWREAPYMSSQDKVWVPGYYSGRRNGWVQGHWVMPD